jgi:hypothetical protein
MPPLCSACRSDRLSAIDEGIVRGVPLAGLARQVGLSRFVLIRHREHRLGKPAAREEHVVVATSRPGADSFFRKIERLEKITERQLSKASRKGRHQSAILAVRELARLAAMSAAASGANAPPAQSTEVGRMIAEAAKRVQEERTAEWERHRSLGKRELLEDALKRFNEQDDSTFAAVAELLRRFQDAGRPAALPAATGTTQTTTDVIDSPIVSETGTAAPNVVTFQRTRHVCRPGRPDDWACPRCLEESRDGAAMRGPLTKDDLRGW